MKQKREYLVNRRLFLKQTSIGIAGFAIAGSSLSLLAADNTEFKISEGFPFLKSNDAFSPVRYRPIATRVTGLKKNTAALDGIWLIDPDTDQGVDKMPASGAGWGNVNVPGQWQQQGLNIPWDKFAALERIFIIPSAWEGYRIFLRFDAIHGGAHYWLNDKPLGYSENLFTPVEWEITDAAKVGQPNRLSLKMKVDTASERLSYMGSDTRNLGGIDRSVKIYALPKLHISTLHLNAGLDRNYENGELQITLGFDNPDPTLAEGFSVAVQLFDSDGKRVGNSNPIMILDPLKPGSNSVKIESQVKNPLKWNAEQPNLYKLVLILKKDGHALEKIEHKIGFRTIETRNRELYVNGVRVKLAGVCHHEIDPISGRADTMRHGEEDVKLFKSANLNDVRTSHYPPTREFLDAADRHGLYVTAEAPFCWVAPAKDLADLGAVLTATSAMIDYNHHHPSVIIWSLANESHWSELFKESDKLCKRLDPTRPTTFQTYMNQEYSEESRITCDIMNRHYPKMPYDLILKDDSRPLMIGECFFEVYHERTDVSINPGLRELWAAGSADPDSEWGKKCIENVKLGGELLPGIYPGAWNYLYSSERCIGSEIWAGIDDIAFLPDGKISSFENGNAYWGLVDGWRRPKPELELAKFVFSSVWFPKRQLDYIQGQSSVRVPVENRYSFTDLMQFDFLWELNGTKGKAHIRLSPASIGEIEIPLQKEIPEGSTLFIRAMIGNNEITNSTLILGEPQKTPIPQPTAGSPKWSINDGLITIKINGFSLVLDQATGDIVAGNSRQQAPILAFPALHVTRYDFGDLDSKKPAYSLLPDAATRKVEKFTIIQVDKGLQLLVKDSFEHFDGIIHWIIDKKGTGKISYDYIYTGDDLDTREIGIMVLLSPRFDKVKWKRWSEWGKFSKDSIFRTEGTAKAWRDTKWPELPVTIKPSWPWSQDQTELGTADFRSTKFCIYEAALLANDDSGVRVNADADTHFRVCLSDQGIRMHVLSQCTLAPAVLKKGDRLQGSFCISLTEKSLNNS